MENTTKDTKTKGTSYRINPEDDAAFKEFYTSKGFSQAEGFSYLIQILELQKAKEDNPDRLCEIEDFERLSKTLLKYYIASIEHYKNAKICAQDALETDLRSKDNTIAALTSQVDTLCAELQVAQQNTDRAKKQAADYATKLSAAQKQITEQLAQIDDLRNQIAAQASLSASLQSLDAVVKALSQDKQ